MRRSCVAFMGAVGARYGFDRWIALNGALPRAVGAGMPRLVCVERGDVL